MDSFEIRKLIAEQTAPDAHYAEFLRVPALSGGLYTLPAGVSDPQQPHSEDEVYYIVSGRGQIRVAEEDQMVEAGTLVYVPAHVPHRFHTIAEDMAILVLFAPAEYSLRDEGQAP
jgi:mannose-6-phosphate isomerase-like protein (cupin superfamily)